MAAYKLAIIKPNKLTYSETFIQAHIDLLAGEKYVLYGGAFPLYRPDGTFLVRSKPALLSYLIQKRLLGKKNIGVRNAALTRFLRENKIDVVLAEYGMVGAMVTQACQAANVPLIVHFHGADAHHRPTISEYRDYYKKAFSYASAIVVVSGDMKKSLETLGAPAEKIILNPYGVDTTRFTPVDLTRESKKNFLAVGRFVTKKSPLTTVEAFRQVITHVPDALLWMVGEGPLLEETKARVAALGLANHITFTGVLSHPQIISLMKSMLCFVQHSVTDKDGDMEGTPNTILEAAASGLPVVSTKHAGIKEAVVDGVTGILVDEFDADGMAAGMVRIASQPSLAISMGQAGRFHILQNYDIKNQMAKLDRIIENVLDYNLS